MHILCLFAPIPFLLDTALAQADVSQVLAQIPPCTQECSLHVLVPAQCQFADFSNCLCMNNTLRLQFSLCVLESCDITKQVVSTAILRDEICKGIPQPSRSAEIIQYIIIIAALTFPVVFLRFYSRSLVASRMWWDDWAIGVAAILMIPMTVIPIFNATRGFGKHFWDIPPQNIILLRKLYYISQIFYIVVQGLAKFSILLLYFRIFPDERFRRVTKIAIGWMVCHTVAFVMVVAFQCTPVESVWNITVPGKCTHSRAFVYAAAALSIFEDTVIMLLPIWELKGLKLDLRRRIALFFLFALGSFACVTSMIRLKYIISYGSSIDITFDNVDVILWSVLETFMAIICASLMCLRPLIVKFLPLLFPLTEVSESTHTTNPSWPQVMKLASKLRTGNNGLELHSDDDEVTDEQVDVIRMQTTWTTKTSTAVAKRIELQERSLMAESHIC